MASTAPSAGKRGRDADAGTLDVVLVCCGQPKLSMGWFHLTQLMANPRVNVRAVVEPWFLGAGKGKPGSEQFQEFVSANSGTHFCAAIADVPPLPAEAEGSPQLFLIAGRTCDAPRNVNEALAAGATHIYVEKPGGESAAQLRAMRAAADERGAAVVVGYNKNVAQYARDAIGDLLERKGSALPQVTLEHCNDFEPGEALVTFLRGPGGEGMLHNMCCHELALACTLLGVTCERVLSVELDPSASELVELGEARSDWKRVKFTLKMRPPAASDSPPPGGVHVDQFTLAADRCGGNYSRIVLGGGGGADADGGSREFRLPSAEHEKWMRKAAAADPHIRPYFLQQAPDYERLKGTFIDHIVRGEPGIPAGVVGLDGAIEALTLADMLVPALKKAWADGEPWTWSPP